MQRITSRQIKQIKELKRRQLLLKAKGIHKQLVNKKIAEKVGVSIRKVSDVKI